MLNRKANLNFKADDCRSMLATVPQPLIGYIKVVMTTFFLITIICDSIGSLIHTTTNFYLAHWHNGVNWHNGVKP